MKINFEKVTSIYIILLPSLLIFTKLGERTYQDVVFISLIVYFVRKKEYFISKSVILVWASWILYELWGFFTDFLGSGEFSAGCFIRGELVFLLPVFLAWVARSDYIVWIVKGFKLALILGGVVSVFQVVVLGLSRAHGQENELVFASCLSIYGLFVIHETIVRHGKSAGIWVVLTLVPIVLSGSRGVVISLLFGLIALAFFIPKKEIVKSIILPMVAVAVIASGVFADRIFQRVSSAQQELVSIDENLGNLFADFIAADFAETGQIKKELPTKDNDHTGVLKEKYKTSIGYRLVFLRGGWKVFCEHPFFGVGNKFDTLRVGEALGIGSSLTLYSHVHNAFLQDLVAGGTLKLILLLLIIFTPIVILFFNKNNKEFSLLVVLGINYIVFGSTNMLFQLTTLNIINTLILVYALGRASFGNKPISAD